MLFRSIAARSPGNGALLNRAIRYLDRVPVAAPALGLQVSDAYQELGVLQENTAPKRGVAVDTYRKAAVSLASCPVDGAVRERLAMLRERMQKLGGTIEEPVAAPSAAPAPVLAPEPPAPKASVAAPAPRVAEAPAPPVNTAMAELQDDLSGAETRIQLAEVTIAPVIASLQREGHTLNTDYAQCHDPHAGSAREGPRRNGCRQRCGCQGELHHRPGLSRSGAQVCWPLRPSNKVVIS